jgi:hypothetical protein
MGPAEAPETVIRAIPGGTVSFKVNANGRYAVVKYNDKTQAIFKQAADANGVAVNSWLLSRFTPGFHHSHRGEEEKVSALVAAAWDSYVASLVVEANTDES